jgi:hypothetical protein
MRRSRLCAALTLCGLLAFATSIGAECGWVLWEEAQYTRFNPYQQTVEWRAGWSAETRDVCQAALLGGLRSEIAQWTKTAKERPGTFEFKSTEIGQMWTLSVKESDQPFSNTLKRYICLPDTIDPRAPKAR